VSGEDFDALRDRREALLMRFRVARALYKEVEARKLWVQVIEIEEEIKRRARRSA